MQNRRLQHELDDARPAMQLAEALQIELNKARETIAEQKCMIEDQETRIDDLENQMLEAGEYDGGREGECDD